MTQLPPSYKTKTLMISLLSALLFSFSVLEASAAALPPAAQPGGVPQGMARPERPSRIEVDIPVVRDRPDVLFDGLDAGVHFAVDDIKIFKIGMNNGVKTREAYVDESLQSIIIDYISKRNGDFTFGYLQDVADKLSDDLKKEDGFLLATVYVPPQKVRNASVEFELLMGELEDVEIVGNDMYAKKYLARAFEDSKGKVVEREAMEESMLLLQEFAGLSASGLLSPGEALGQSKLLITVNSEKRFEGQLLADNYGSDFTGKGRVGAHLEFNNPLNLLDKLTVDIFGVERPNDIANSDDRLQERLYGGFRYEARPFDTRWGMGVEAGSNTYEVGSFGNLSLGQLNITGYTKSARTFLVNSRLRSRASRVDLEFGLKLEEATTEANGVPNSRDDLTTIDAAIRFQHNDSWLKMCGDKASGGTQSRGCPGVTLGEFKLVQGIRNFLGSMDDGTDPSAVPPGRILNNEPGQPVAFADARFFKLEYSLIRLQKLRFFDVLLTIKGQHTNEALLSVEQHSLGGPSSVRAYPTGAFLADKAYYAGLNFQKQVRGVSLSVFYDYTQGKNFETSANDPKDVDLQGFGVAMSFNPLFLPDLRIDISSAWATGSDLNIDIRGENVNGVTVFGRDAPDRRRPMVFGSLTYQL